MRTLSSGFFLLIVSNVLAQTVKFSKISEAQDSTGLYNCIYSIQIYNNTDIPICIPVSLSFGYAPNLYDTIEVADIYPIDDSIVTFSLYYSKYEIERSFARYPAIPVVITPGTYFLTNIWFKKSEKNIKAYLALKCSYDKKLDYYKINDLFMNNPKYVWMNEVNFIDTNYPIY